MRKKPDILLLLAIVVVSGVIFSNFVVFKKENKVNHLSLFKSPASSPKEQNPEPFKPREVVRIDSSKRQTR